MSARWRGHFGRNLSICSQSYFPPFLCWFLASLSSAISSTLSSLGAPFVRSKYASWCGSAVTWSPMTSSMTSETRSFSCMEKTSAVTTMYQVSLVWSCSDDRPVTCSWAARTHATCLRSTETSCASCVSWSLEALVCSRSRSFQKRFATSRSRPFDCPINVVSSTTVVSLSLSCSTRFRTLILLASVV